MREKRGIGKNLWKWIDGQGEPIRVDDAAQKEFNWIRCIPFLAMHLACLLVIFVGWSWFAIGTAVVLYWVRMFAITGFYHRYFSHRSFKSSRACQFIFALLGCSAVQRGPLWWAAHHRNHHRNADKENDVHSPVRQGFWWSHILWITSDKHFPTRFEKIRDFAKYPELRFLNRFDTLVPLLFAGLIFATGMVLERRFPSLGTNGPQLLVWGFLVSTIVLFHATFTINSIAHLIGKRRYALRDNSRNNWFLALITLGEGWHNNHHRYPNSVRQGFTWWELDITFYILKVLSWFGLIWDLKEVPARILTERSSIEGKNDEAS